MYRAIVTWTHSRGPYAATPLKQPGTKATQGPAFAPSVRFGAQLIGRLACILTGLGVPLLFRH
jgi:hypothetical protein